MASDDDFDIGIVIDVLFGLDEAEARDEDLFIVGDDEVLVPRIGDVSSTVFSGLGDGHDAVMLDAIEENLG